MIRRQLVELVGFEVPDALVTIVEAFVKREGEFRKGVDLLGLEYLNLGHGLLDSFECRYESTPVEFFPFLSTGGDGVSHGYVIHAPELDSDDWPMGSLVPGDSDGVTHIGDSTVAAIENLISYRLDSDGVDMIDLELLGSLGIAPSAAKAGNIRLRRDGEYVRPRPRIPDGWKHVMTSDGVGVLAHASQFRDSATASLSRGADAEDLMRLAQRATVDGFHGDALCYLKEAWWHRYHDLEREPLKRLKVGLVTVYEKLGKSLLAETLDRYFHWV